jgi:hypothetical protein
MALETSASSCCTMAPLPAKSVTQTTSTDNVIVMMHSTAFSVKWFHTDLQQ